MNQDEESETINLCPCGTLRKGTYCVLFHWRALYGWQWLRSTVGL